MRFCFLQLKSTMVLFCFLQVKSTMVLEKPNVIRHEMLGTDGGKDSTCWRTFFQDKMDCFCKVDDIETLRVYKRLPN